MSTDEHSKIGRYPLNVDGPFYVINGACICCMMPEHEAPELMGFDSEKSHCYFKRQPQTPEEVGHAVSAMMNSCIEGLRYAGNDPVVLERLSEMESLCDVYGVRPCTWQRMAHAHNAPPSGVGESKSVLRRVIDFIKGEW